MELFTPRYFLRKTRKISRKGSSAVQSSVSVWINREMMKDSLLSSFFDKINLGEERLTHSQPTIILNPISSLAVHIPIPRFGIFSTQTHGRLVHESLSRYHFVRVPTGLGNILSFMKQSLIPSPLMMLSISDLTSGQWRARPPWVSCLSLLIWVYPEQPEMDFI